MNLKPAFLIVLFLFLFFLSAFYLEVSTYSVLPKSLDDMSFWMEFQSIWYRSIWFCAMLVCISLFGFLGFLKFKRK